MNTDMLRGHGYDPRGPGADRRILEHVGDGIAGGRVGDVPVART
jgi:hypothetical protein